MRLEKRTTPSVAALILAPAFDGLSRIQQHRLVYDIFEPGEIGGPIHALSIKTETP